LTYRAHVTELYGHVIISENTVIQPRDEELENMFPFIEPPEAPSAPDYGSMVLIEGGEYAIGPDEADPSGASPRGTVDVDDFYIDKYEVTIGEYTDFLNAGGHDDYYWIDMADPDWCGIIKNDDGDYEVVPGKADYPVVLLKLEGAEAYAEWAGKRLPTEYEWEIAARGAAERAYPWGDQEPSDNLLNYNFRIGHTVRCGSYPDGVTPEGVHDMAGNVCEMLANTWAAYPWGEPQEFENIRARKVCRGGSWVSSDTSIKATYRDVVKSHNMNPYTGFRCAKDAD
jgi:formylglycine-generating enzyme required for sulfatase activity